MIFLHKYRGETTVSSSRTQTGMTFVPDSNRAPTHFIGSLNKKIPFREAISALHDVVVSDLRIPLRNRDDYKEWIAKMDNIQVGEEILRMKKNAAQLNEVTNRLLEVTQQVSALQAPYYTAQNRYFKYLYKHDYKAWLILDPVITVHPDELFFECFSKDESSYGRLSCSHNVFNQIGEFACGTTNIDYSADLYSEFQKIRNYRETELKIDPGGFEVQTDDDDALNETKIDVPDSWVRGFLQVSSAMTLPAYYFDLHPMDIHNICFLLRRRRETQGPRSLRFQLDPGKPVRIIVEPWNTELICNRSPYNGTTATEVRVWGRRRLLTLERLIPVAKRFRVFLLGSGMPSFYLADLGDMTFTLGLSGWTANDWSRMGNFDLLAPRTPVDSETCNRVFQSLKENWFESAESLSTRLNLDRGQVGGALSIMTQAGRVIYDLNQQVYRIRELTPEPLPLDKLRYANEREQKANELLETGETSVTAIDHDNGLSLKGLIVDAKNNYQPNMIIDLDDRMVRATCTCNFYTQNKLRMGPCEHILATRLAHERKKTPSSSGRGK